MSAPRVGVSEVEVVSNEDVETFQQDGVVCLRQVFSPEWLKLVEEGITANRANPSKYGEALTGPGGEGEYFNDYCNWQSIPQFREFVFKSPAAAIAGQLMKSETAVFYHEHVLVKEAHTDKMTPWHHDQAYYPVDGFKNCSLWMPLDPVSQEMSIQFVIGSHRWGRWFYPRKFETANNYPIACDVEGHTFEDVPEIDPESDKYDVISWSVQPGDCIAFHMLTLHGAPSNLVPTPRRVLSTRWLGEDAVMARRPWEVSPPILGSLNYGDKMQSELFPLIWKYKE